MMLHAIPPCNSNTRVGQHHFLQLRHHNTRTDQPTMSGPGESTKRVVMGLDAYFQNTLDESQQPDSGTADQPIDVDEYPELLGYE